MRAPLVHLVGIGKALALLVVPLTPANAAESALNDPRYQRLMPSEPGGVANPLPGQSGGVGLGGGGAGAGRGDGSSAVDNTRTERTPRPPRTDDGPPPDITAIGKTVLWILLAVVARRIQRRIKWQSADHFPTASGPFLQAFYTALRGHLEQKMLLGERRRDKFHKTNE